jgi:hypothetical protein
MFMWVPLEHIEFILVDTAGEPSHALYEREEKMLPMHMK